MKNCIGFIAGRSGGHIIPALTLAEQMINRKEIFSILFFTTHYSIDKKIIQSSKIVTHHIPLPLSNISLNPLKLILFIGQFFICMIKSFSLLHTHKPEKIITTGGYIALPVCIAARLLKIPVQLYVLDAVPGKAAKLLAPLCSKIFICFEQALALLPQKKCHLIDYPIRFNSFSEKTNIEEIRNQLGLLPQKRTIFIHGGSQGSVSINNHIKNWIEFNPHAHALIQIIHQTGSSDTTNWKELYDSYDIPSVVFDYKDDLAVCYTASDIIISRAGAGALFEVLFFNKPCLVIPLEAKTTSHQKDNAAAMAQKYPKLFTVLTENQIKYNNMLLFTTLNNYIYANPAHSKTGKELLNSAIS